MSKYYKSVIDEIHTFLQKLGLNVPREEIMESISKVRNYGQPKYEYVASVAGIIFEEYLDRAANILYYEYKNGGIKHSREELKKIIYEKWKQNTDEINNIINIRKSKL